MVTDPRPRIAKIRALGHQHIKEPRYRFTRLQRPVDSQLLGKRSSGHLWLGLWALECRFKPQDFARGPRLSGQGSPSPNTRDQSNARLRPNPGEPNAQRHESPGSPSMYSVQCTANKMPVTSENTQPETFDFFTLDPIKEMVLEP